MKRSFELAAAAAMTLALGAGSAGAQTTVKWMHIEMNPNIANYYKQVVSEFEAKNPSVKVDVQVLENEAYKAKLTTLLQSSDKPHIIYSWGGGVMQSQVRAGVLQDIDAPMKGAWADSLSAGAVDAVSAAAPGAGGFSSVVTSPPMEGPRCPPPGQRPEPPALASSLST